MPKTDIYHDTVKRALIKDRWTITHDPFPLPIGRKRLYIDLGANKLISAVRGNRQIAVEIKSFVGASDVHDLELALGQYILYQKILQRVAPERILYLAVPKSTFEETFQIDVGSILLDDQTIRLLVFDEMNEEVILWLPAWTDDSL